MWSDVQAGCKQDIIFAQLQVTNCTVFGGKAESEPSVLQVQVIRSTLNQEVGPLTGLMCTADSFNDKFTVQVDFL